MVNVLFLHVVLFKWHIMFPYFNSNWTFVEHVSCFSRKLVGFNIHDVSRKWDTISCFQVPVSTTN